MPSFAESNGILSAGQLLDACTRPDMDWISFCNGFFQAAHDNGALNDKICADGVTRTDLAVLYEKDATRLIAANKEISERSGLRVAVAIFTQAYPCK